MTYLVDFHEKVFRELQKLPRLAFGQAVKALIELASEPRPRGVKKLADTVPPLYRVRIGDYRIVYSIDDHEKLVGIQRVAHRREVYD